MRTEATYQDRRKDGQLYYHIQGHLYHISPGGWHFPPISYLLTDYTCPSTVLLFTAYRAVHLASCFALLCLIHKKTGLPGE